MSTGERRSRAGPLLLGAFVIGTLDIAYAIAFWGIRSGVRPGRIFQSVAAGILGPAALERGVASVALGAFLHYFIALMIVLVYWWASRWAAVLIERPYLFGAIYGLLVYAVMNYVVIPLSATSRPRFLLSWVVCSIVVHALFVGIPAALSARRATA